MSTDAILQRSQIESTVERRLTGILISESPFETIVITKEIDTLFQLSKINETFNFTQISNDERR